MINILFVCVGNTCRSAMCEYLFKYKIKKLNLYNKFEVKSCGIFASYNQPAAQNAINAIYHLNNDIKTHRSTPISSNLIKQSNYIFALDQTVINFIRQNFYNDINGHISCINKDGISDPYGSSLDNYKTCAKIIEKYLDNILKKIIKDEKL